MFRLQPAPGDEPLHRIQQFQPILERRFRHGLPLIKSFFPLEKTPIAAHALGINLQLYAGGVYPFPTDFSFGHEVLGLGSGVQGLGWSGGQPQSPDAKSQIRIHSGNSMLATAMAAMPSSRPMKPMCSFVVALTPTSWKLMPSASAMRIFISRICG